MLARQDLRQLVLTKDLSALFELETCLAGGTDLAEQLPRRENRPLPEVCDEIAELAPSKVVYGPATFLYQSVAQIQQLLQGQIGPVQEAARRAGPPGPAQARLDGASPEEQQEAAQAAAQAVLGQVQASCCSSRFSTTSPAVRSWTTRSSSAAWSSIGQAGRDAQGALRVPLPEAQRRR